MADLPTIEERLRTILGLFTNKSRNGTNMLFFVMYDIESNKVRRMVFKYLIQQGCHRVQNSIFIADLSLDKFDKISSDLREVQAFYDNNDSILIVPVSTDLLKSMKIIGKNIDIDVIMKTKNVLFF